MGMWIRSRNSSLAKLVPTCKRKGHLSLPYGRGVVPKTKHKAATVRERPAYANFCKLVLAGC
jgi:hypothetical protein